MNFPSINQFSIAKGTGGTKPPEMYIPLWWYSGNSGQTCSYTASGSGFIAKSYSSAATSSSNTAAKLLTLSSSWSQNLKFALEASVYNNATVQYGYAALWDITSNSIVSASQISGTGGVASVVRSGQFTLIPGHSYGITIWSSVGSSNAYLLDASLIVFPS